MSRSPLSADFYHLGLQGPRQRSETWKTYKSLDVSIFWHYYSTINSHPCQQTETLVTEHSGCCRYTVPVHLYIKWLRCSHTNAEKYSISDPAGRLIFVSGSVNSVPLALLNFYAPNSDWGFLQNIWPNLGLQQLPYVILVVTLTLHWIDPLHK